MDYILETRNLTKKIKSENIIKGISLKIPKGETYGLLGPNGAGKSTTMKLLCGLLKPSSGEIIFNGKQWSKDALSKIGVLIENPAIYGNLTAKENMEIHACMLGVPEKEIRRVLTLLKMDKTGKKKVSNFSLGMKQRLGIAMALLNTPEFLILDEPVNGLDPDGIVKIRRLLKTLNQEYGMTILISSHILEELYQTATEFIFIDRGRIVEEISVRALNEHCKRYISIRTTDTQGAILAIEERLLTDHFRMMPDNEIRLYDYLDNMEKVAKALAEAQILVTGLSITGGTLEDYFLTKVGENRWQTF